MSAPVIYPLTCDGCKGTAEDVGAPLKGCGGCGLARYCSRTCQRGNWKWHKRICSAGGSRDGQQNACRLYHAQFHAQSTVYDPSTQQVSAVGSTPLPLAVGSGTDSTEPLLSFNQGGSRVLRNLTSSPEKPFHRLRDRKYLHDRHEEDVFKLLIDSYRLDVHQDAKQHGWHIQKDKRSQHFELYLRSAEEQSGLLPDWWTEEKRDQCIAYSKEDGWTNLDTDITWDSLVQRYGKASAPQQLYVLVEQVFGTESEGLTWANNRAPNAELAMEAQGGWLEYCRPLVYQHL